MRRRTHSKGDHSHDRELSVHDFGLVKPWALNALTILSFLFIFAAVGIYLKHPTEAASNTGICSTNQNPKVCWRVNNGGVDGWPQDISGDPNQQWSANYEGGVSTGWPFSTASFNTTYHGDGVYEFANPSSGKCAGTAGGNYQEMLMVSCSPNTGYLFVWTSSGYIINVLNSDHDGQTACVTDNGNYNDEYAVATCDATWQQLAGSNPTPNPTPAPTPNPTPNPTPQPTAQPTPAPTPAPTPDQGGGGDSGGGSSGGSGGSTGGSGGTTGSTGGTTTDGSGGGSGGSSGGGSGGGGGGGVGGVASSDYGAVAVTPTPSSTAPNAPTNFTATTSGTSSVVALKWDPSTDPYLVAPVLTYELDRSIDQTNWTVVNQTISDTSYSDTNTDFSVHYYYRLVAQDTTGNASPYAYADTVTPAFASNVSASGGSTTYTSSDGLATVLVPSGAVPSNVNCAVAANDQVIHSSSEKVVAGPYQLVCKDANGNTLASVTESLQWTINLKGKLKGLGAPAAYEADPNGTLTLQKGASYDSKSQTIGLQLDSANAVVVLAPPAASFPWGFVALVLLVLGIMGGLASLVLNRQRRANFNDYLRQKYYNI